MGLRSYNAKRNFKKTPEPKGDVQQVKRGGLLFVVHKHDASHLHYDVRLELGGVLKSWAVPKGPSLRLGVKRLAAKVEDHPFDYRNFEGIIPEGEYGAGPVIIWDEGTYYSPLASTKAESERILKRKIKEGKFVVFFEGEKLKGAFAFVRMHDDDWLLIKERDEFVSRRDITKEDASVRSGRTIEDICKGRKGIASKKRSSKESTSVYVEVVEGRRAVMPHHVVPMLATLVDKPFDRAGWLFEIKWDGFRAIAEVSGRSALLYSRNGNSMNDRFAPIVKALQSFKHKAVLDGEVVVLDKKGTSHFQLLQDYPKSQRGDLCFYVFDVLWLDGYDVTGLSLMARKRLLKAVLPRTGSIRYSDHIEGKGKAFFTLAKKHALEGVVAKNASSTYQKGARGMDWLKIKTHLRQEAVICGFTEPRNTRSYFGALVLGVYEKGKLIYIGHTGGGFNSSTLGELHAAMKPLIQKKSPFELVPKTNMPVTWIRPQLVCEVQFSNWTKEGVMRQPIFLGVRDDKKAKDVGRELARKHLVKKTK